jgi:hypothetical protein
MRRERIWRTVVLLLVISGHAWLGLRWANHQPAPLRVLLHPPTPSQETLLVLTFTTRASTAPSATPPAVGRSARQPTARRRRGSMGAGATDPAGRRSQPAIAPSPLNLAVVPAIRNEAYRRDVLAHRNVLDARTTRFDGAWRSDGNVVDIAARRSRVAGVILGALGALTKPCTARQIRNYDPACVPAQYVDRDPPPLPED